ncbi:hypothetical protein HDU98_012181 [Podochytrium sp. JEL0797]|nr:hypothetical protein HDU98_012181 [Podochytrium sp. JEL0797]
MHAFFALAALVAATAHAQSPACVADATAMSATLASCGVAATTTSLTTAQETCMCSASNMAVYKSTATDCLSGGPQSIALAQAGLQLTALCAVASLAPACKADIEPLTNVFTGCKISSDTSSPSEFTPTQWSCVCKPANLSVISKTGVDCGLTGARGAPIAEIQSHCGGAMVAPVADVPAPKSGVASVSVTCAGVVVAAALLL